MDKAATRGSGLRLGMACLWGPVPRATWSGTPWRLRAAMQPRVQIVDVGPHLSRPAREALRLAGVRRSGTGWRSQWRHSRAAVALLEQDLRRQVRRASPDVVLEIGDLAAVDVPVLVLQDLSYALLLERYGPDGVPHFRTLGRRRIDELRRRQQDIYERAAGLLPMSRWLASSLVRSGVDAERVHVINPGVNLDLTGVGLIPERRTGPTRRLLMVGRDFDTKGGAQVLGAFALLRREHGPKIELTIAGPRTWPGRGEVPAGVTFLGDVPGSKIQALMDSHDLFVLPSRFEGFGIAFVEALVRGLPCIGRDDCAMPEIIDPVSGGRLVRSEDPAELAALIEDALGDDHLYRECARRAPELLAHYSWDRAARDVVVVAEGVRR